VVTLDEWITVIPKGLINHPLARQAKEPMTTRQLALQVMAARGLNTDDAALVVNITRRVGASLRSYRDNGTIRSLKDGRYGKYDLWEIAR
jgi:hypothetical protein